MLWGRKGSKPDKNAAKTTPEDLVKSLGGETEVERLEKELAAYRKKGVTVRMETDGDGRKVLVPVKAEEKAGKKK